MYDISEIKRFYSIRSALNDVGISVVRNKALCPFHDDKRPSLSIKEERYMCFACGESGDVIDFTSKYHGLSTGKAIHYLANNMGLDKEVTSEELSEKSRISKKKRQLTETFKSWESDEMDNLLDLRNECKKLKKKVGSNFDKLKEIVSIEDYIEYAIEILVSRDDKEKLELFLKGEI